MDGRENNHGGSAGKHGAATLPAVPGYAVVRRLGAGGSGSVFLAERASPEAPVKVAIKVLRPGGVPDNLIDRFQRECTLLSRLEHPHIARFLDSGMTGEGQPFIAMEFIDGRTMRQWMEEDRPGLDARLDLFLQAAEAVEFAHQNLVVHRDLTLENLLVTDDGNVMLIDFGVAASDVAEAGSSTTLPDIYALGLILAALTGEDAKSELDAIAAKAAAGKPVDRFGSVSEMIGEVENYRAKLPVVSYSNTAFYRVSKFIARERVLVGFAGVALMTLLIGGIGSGVAFERYSEAQVLENAGFDGAREMVRYQLFELDDQLDHLPDKTPARLALAQQSQLYLNGLSRSRNMDTGLQLEIAEDFIRLAYIQGVPGHPNLGKMDQANANLAAAEQIVDRFAQGDNAQAHIAASLIESHRAQILAHSAGEGDLEEARLSLNRAEEELDLVPASGWNWQWMDARRHLRTAMLAWADIAHDPAMLAAHSGALESDQEIWPAQKRGGYEGRLDRALAAHYRAVMSHEEETPAGFRAALEYYRQADALLTSLGEDFPGDPDTLYWRAWNSYFGYSAATSLGREQQASQLLSAARSSADRLAAQAEADVNIAELRDYLQQIGEGQNRRSMHKAGALGTKD